MTHRIVFWKTLLVADDKNNNNNKGGEGGAQRRRRIARNLHLSNVFAIETKTPYFKSPKIMLSTSLGE
jgi:hypothetical protein